MCLLRKNRSQSAFPPIFHFTQGHTRSSTAFCLPCLLCLRPCSVSLRGGLLCQPILDWIAILGRWGKEKFSRGRDDKTVRGQR